MLSGAPVALFFASLVRQSCAMDHWLRNFVNRPLPRPLFVAVRWARLAELWAAFAVHRAFARLRFLCVLEVDFERIDHEQQLRYLALMDEALRPPAPPLRPEPSGPSGSAASWPSSERGIWV